MFALIVSPLFTPRLLNDFVIHGSECRNVFWGTSVSVTESNFYLKEFQSSSTGVSFEYWPVNCVENDWRSRDRPSSLDFFQSLFSRLAGLFRFAEIFESISTISWSFSPGEKYVQDIIATGRGIYHLLESSIIETWNVHSGAPDTDDSLLYHVASIYLVDLSNQLTISCSWD